VGFVSKERMMADPMASEGQRCVAIVVPCFNEAARLDADQFARLAADQTAGLRILVVFVNDGSTDATLDRLREIQARRPEHVEILDLSKNGGKGEAVRQGMLHALGRDVEIVGYLDADLSVPVDELLDLVRVMERTGAEVVLGARVTMLGRQIERKAMRHYLGRVFASAASLTLGLRVYDTQCGGKLFRARPVLREALGEPFLSRWAFDVELLGRLLIGNAYPPVVVQQVVEHPLQVWREKAGSKLHLGGMLRAAADLGLVANDLARRRRSLNR
jgi:dolichyl-phosphate beta-glucosyltransferase